MLFFPFMLKAQTNLPDTTTVDVKGGRFYMGNTPEQESGYYDDNKNEPVHEVYLSDYRIGKYTVTVSDFAIFIKNKEKGYETEAEKQGRSKTWKHNEQGELYPEEILNTLKYPVINISYNDAKAYCDWLSKETKDEYRLPTEAEWEYAARGGQKSKGYKYSGNNIIDSVAWYSGKEYISNSWYDDGDDYYAPKRINNPMTLQFVGKKTANELGVYDMSGNVWEYCSDFHGTYTVYTQNNPKGNVKNTELIVIRGGGFNSSAKECQVAYRGGYSDSNVLPASFKYYDYLYGNKTIVGFRIVREIKAKK